VNGSDPADFANAGQAEFWSNLAPTWIELEDQLEEVSGRQGVGQVTGRRVGARVSSPAVPLRRPRAHRERLSGPGPMISVTFRSM
jgi:hypothetical protein